MEHNDTPKQLLGRVMHVGQLLANVATSHVKGQQSNHTLCSSSRLDETLRNDCAQTAQQAREKHSFGK